MSAVRITCRWCGKNSEPVFDYFGQRICKQCHARIRNDDYISALEAELARLRAQIDGAHTVLDAMYIDSENMQPGETRTFKLVPVEVDDEV